MAESKAQMDVELVAIGSLKLDDKNPRIGNVDAIAESLKEFGQHRPVVAQKRTKRIIAGNHLVLAAQSLGWSEINVVFVDDDDEKAIRRGIADNATNDLAKWDDDVLSALLEEVGSDVPGVDAKMLARLTKEIIETIRPVYPIVAKPGEYYDYIMFFTESELDSLFIRSMFPGKWICWKAEKRPATWSHMLPVEELRKVLKDSGVTPDIEAYGEE